MMWNVYSAGWFWPLCVVAGLVLLSLGLILFSRWFSNNVDRDAKLRRQDKALEIARERFARGEITAEEFESLKRGLIP
jgi:putative membrane protein